MIYLFLTVFSMVAFMQTLRYGQQALHVYAIVAVNYVVATIAVFTVSGLQMTTMGMTIPWHPMAIGAATGVLYISHIPITLGCFRRAGVGVTVAVGGCSLIVPALAGWAVWEESMTVYRWLALALVPPAMWIMRPGNGLRSRLTLTTDVLLIANFAASGLVYSLQKYADVYFVAENREIFKVTLFGTAALSSLLFAIYRRTPFHRRDIGAGILLGLLNAATLIFTLLALQVMAAVVFFPTSMCLVIGINAVTARFLWQERLKHRQYAGLICALIVIALINLPG